MEVAFHYVSERKDRPSGDDVRDLVLLDVTNSQRKKLAERVAWNGPFWTADGQGVRYEQRVPGTGFLWREVAVETGEIRTIEDQPNPPLSWREGDYVWSPGRQWVAYSDTLGPVSTFAIARTDGSEIFYMEWLFNFFCNCLHWSPDGTRLATDLTASEHTGSYVIDLYSGQHQRVTPPLAPYPEPDPAYHTHGWSPDGRWLAVTKNRWHNPKTYDFEWNELWLMAADGSEMRQLTDDGLCLHPAIRPSSESPGSLEDELRFEWAKTEPSLKLWSSRD